MGLNQDEASAGYEAYSLMKYGEDRNGIKMPVHFIAWGSGQNALYSYLCIPFIKILGLSEFSLRLPMALIGCVSIVAFYFLIKNIFDKNAALMGMFFISIAPWHIMKSRWALESNLFPDLILYCVLFMVLYLNKKKKIYICLAAFLLGISAYSYGTAYCFIPVFIIPIFVYFIVKKKISIKDGIIVAIISLITALPMILFVIINTFQMNSMDLFFITIPRLYVSRHMEKASVFSGDFLRLTYENFKATMDVILIQEDGLPWNSIKYYGITYIISIPFIVIGLLAMIKEKNNKAQRFILLMWGLAAFAVSCIVEVNINRINVLMIPLIIYASYGIYIITKDKTYIKNSIVGMYILLFISFCDKYFGEYQEHIAGYFFYSLGDAIEYANSMGVDKIYITDNVNMPYIYALFYDTKSGENYLDTVEFYNNNSAFCFVKSYDKYNFYIPDEIEKNTAVIVDNYDAQMMDLEGYTVKKFEKYVVIVD